MDMKTVICYTAGLLGGMAAYFFGAFSLEMQTLTVMMAIDILTGLIVAAVFRKSKKTESGALSSAASFKGLCKKFVIFLYVGMANILDIYLGTDFLRSAVIGGFTVNEIISVAENAALMGVTSPPIERALDILKKRFDKEDKIDR